jgi:hypothetical protein
VSDIGQVPFRQDFRDSLLIGALRATARDRKLGEPGDVFWAFGVRCVLTEVKQKVLDDVAMQHWQETGCKSASDFIRLWGEIHPRAIYDGSRRVWLHRFEKLASQLTGPETG